MTCAEVVALCSEYVEGRMPFGRRLSFQLHLGICSLCRRYVRQMKVARATLGHLPDTPPSPEVAEALMHHFRSWKAGELPPETGS